MKTLILFLLLSTLSFAQTWAPIGAKWTYTQSTINPNYITFKTFESNSDTSINGQSCKILNVIENSGPGFSITYQEFTYSDSNKVYFYKDNEWCLIYDFNAKQNDSFVLNCTFGAVKHPVVVKVLAVDTITINGKQLKRFDYSVFDLIIGFSGFVIEGIGNIYGMFPNVHHTYGGPLRCYEDTILGHYKNQYYNWNTAWQADCDLIITNVDKPNVAENSKVFPNPFYDHLTFQFLNNIQTRVTLYDLMGKCVLDQIFTNYATINTEHLPRSIYFYEVRSNNGTRKTGMIIKR